MVHPGAEGLIGRDDREHANAYEVFNARKHRGSATWLASPGVGTGEHVDCSTPKGMRSAHAYAAGADGAGQVLNARRHGYAKMLDVQHAVLKLARPKEARAQRPKASRRRSHEVAKSS